MMDQRNTLENGLVLIVPAGLLALVGYLIVMGPWHLRSLKSFWFSFLLPVADACSGFKITTKHLSILPKT